MTWWSLHDDGGCLELDFPALELHVTSFGGRLLAFWLDGGRFLGLAHVGLS